MKEATMSRFQLVSAYYNDAPGIGKLRAGRTVADSQANALAGDVVWPNLTAATLPQGFVPIDGSAYSMWEASQWANTPFPATILGADSIG
jgi:hypothetical protein